MEPKVSMIIISYNCAEYISEAIDSCLSQSYKNIEIIIGDDGSTDQSKEIIDGYVVKYPDIISSYVMNRPSDESNIIPSIRVSENIKHALTYATGKYICVMSADDYYEDKSLIETQIKILEANDEYAAVACGYRMVWPDGKSKEVYIPRKINALFWSGYYVHVSCLLIRQDVFKGRYFLPRLCDDTGLLYSVIASGKCLGIPLIGFSYRQRGGSIMHKADEMELSLLELLLYQDVLQVGELRWSSLCRFAKPMNYIISHVECLKNEKYKKYLNETENNKDDFVRDLLNCNDGKMWKKKMLIICYISKMVSFLSAIVRKVYYGYCRLLR